MARFPRRPYGSAIASSICVCAFFRSASHSRVSVLPSLKSTIARSSFVSPLSSSLTIASMRSSFASKLGARGHSSCAPVRRVPQASRGKAALQSSSPTATFARIAKGAPGVRNDCISAFERALRIRRKQPAPQRALIAFARVENIRSRRLDRASNEPRLDAFRVQRGGARGFCRSMRFTSSSTRRCAYRESRRSVAPLSSAFDARPGRRATPDDEPSRSRGPTALLLAPHPAGHFRPRTGDDTRRRRSAS